MNKSLAGVGILIINKKGKVLLQLRDNKKSIKFPNTWTTFGGGIEKNETPLEALKRELIEEMEYTLDDAKYLGNFPWKGINQYVFVKHDDLDENEIRLNEGETAKFFSKSEIKNIKLGFNMKEILDYYFKQK